MVEALLLGVKHLQNIHPLLDHFPIAFLMGAALFTGWRGFLEKTASELQPSHFDGVNQ